MPLHLVAHELWRDLFHRLDFTFDPVARRYSKFHDEDYTESFGLEILSAHPLEVLADLEGYLMSGAYPASVFDRIWWYYHGAPYSSDQTPPGNQSKPAVLDDAEWV